MSIYPCRSLTTAIAGQEGADREVALGREDLIGTETIAAATSNDDRSSLILVMYL